MTPRVAVDGFLIAYPDETAGQIKEKLDNLEAQGYEVPAYLVVRNQEGKFLGILARALLNFMENSDAIATQTQLQVVRRQVSMDAPEEEQLAVVQASQGVALGIDTEGRPMAVLRAMRLGDGIYIPSDALITAGGEMTCPYDGRKFRRPDTIRVREKGTGLWHYRFSCPFCGRVLPDQG